jgi:hypothetical protein
MSRYETAGSSSRFKWQERCRVEAAAYRKLMSRRYA